MIAYFPLALSLLGIVMVIAYEVGKYKRNSSMSVETECKHCGQKFSFFAFNLHSASVGDREQAWQVLNNIKNHVLNCSVDHFNNKEDQ